MSITESDEGLTVAATRQCAGSIAAGAAAGAPPRPPPRPPGAAAAPRPPPRPAPSPRPPPAGATTGPPGGPPGAGAVYGPAGTSSADVTVVFDRVTVRRLSHGAACARAAINDRAER